MTEKFIRHFFFSFFLILLSVQTLHAGNFGEHKLIGDSAFKKVCETHPKLVSLLKELLNSKPLDINSPLIPISSNDPDHFYRKERYAGMYPLDTLKGKALTYGDITGLSGDHMPDYIEMYRRFFPQDGRFVSSGLYQLLFNDVVKEYERELQNLNEGHRGYNPMFYEFVKLSIQDHSHFHIPAASMRKEIDAVGVKGYNDARNFLYSGAMGNVLAILNNKKILDAFESNSVAKYTIIHTIAKLIYTHVGESLDEIKDKEKLAKKMADRIAGGNNSESTRNNYAAVLHDIDLLRANAKTYLLLTLFTNAFSEHYLQDMFASGHFFADRQAYDPLAMEAKGIHDYFGRNGINSFVEGKQVKLYGDDQYDSVQCNMAIAANIASLEDLLTIDTLGPRQPEYDFLLLLDTPTEEPSQIFPALKKVPDVPLGKNYSSQRENIGRSLSGLYYGLYGLSVNKFGGGGIMTGLNFLFKTPKRDSRIENYFGFGFHGLLEVTSDKRNEVERTLNRRLGLGVNVLLHDYVYGYVTATSGIPEGIHLRYEVGVQFKPNKWSYGFHIGLVEYSTSVTPYPHLSVSIIHY